VILISASGEKVKMSDPRVQLIFNHQFHLTNVGASCEDCHAKARESLKAEDNLYPQMKVCAECHDIESAEGCVVCHRDPLKIIPTSGFQPNYEVFTHKKHLNAGFDCTKCHSQIVNSTQLTQDELLFPKMSDCIDCHRGRGQTLDCADCHYGKHPAPGDKSVLEWTRTHGLEASFDPERFEKYFEMGYCEDCHQGLNLRGEMHQPGWLFVHGDEAAAGNECLVCHEDLANCSSCHRAMLPVPHPLGDPNFADEEEGGEHTEEAKAFFEACIACHDEGTASPTCYRCHGEGGAEGAEGNGEGD
jgi:hypothetical protein